MDYLSMTFKQPAAKWYEALPLGNGSMGAMSYGRFQNEKIELNLDTLWSGTGKRKENPNREIDWEFLRNNIFDEKYQEAEDYCQKNVLGDWTESYLPAGNLKIDVKVPVLTEAGSYKRQLSFKEAIENVEFCQEGKRYQRGFFVSMAEPVMHFIIIPARNAALKWHCLWKVRYTIRLIRLKKTDFLWRDRLLFL